MPLRRDSLPAFAAIYWMLLGRRVGGMTSAIATRAEVARNEIKTSPGIRVGAIHHGPLPCANYRPIQLAPGAPINRATPGDF